MKKLDELMLKGKIKALKVKESLLEERGDTNIVAIVLILAVVIALAVIFRTRITAIVNGLFDSVDKQATDAVK